MSRCLSDDELQAIADGEGRTGGDPHTTECPHCAGRLEARRRMTARLVEAAGTGATARRGARCDPRAARRRRGGRAARRDDAAPGAARARMGLDRRRGSGRGAPVFLRRCPRRRSSDDRVGRRDPRPLADRARRRRHRDRSPDLRPRARGPARRPDPAGSRRAVHGRGDHRSRSRRALPHRQAGCRRPGRRGRSRRCAAADAGAVSARQRERVPVPVHGRRAHGVVGARDETRACSRP